MPVHISQQFDRELEDMRSKVLAMGGLVEEQLDVLLAAVATESTERMQAVIDADRQVETRQREIEEDCFAILARRTPAASDLRLVMAVSRITMDLENCSYEVEGLAEPLTELLGAGHSRSVCQKITSVGYRVRGTLHGALDAFARNDPDLAKAVADAGTADQPGSLRSWLVEDHADTSLSCLINVVRSVDCLERVGARARNTCGIVAYLVNGVSDRRAYRSVG